MRHYCDYIELLILNGKKIDYNEYYKKLIYKTRKRLYIPYNIFWFNATNYLPRIALPYHEKNINIKLPN